MFKKVIFLFAVLALTACQSTNSTGSKEQAVTETTTSQASSSSGDEERLVQFDTLLSERGSFYYQVFQSLEKAKEAPETISIEGKTFYFYALETVEDSSEVNYYYVIYTEDKETP